jgi:hypothetical protein
MKNVLAKYRSLLVVAILLLTVVSAAGMFVAFSQRGLPEPAKANRQELLRWLIAEDLARQTPETLLSLAERLEVEFGSGVDWAAFQSRLDDSQRRRLLQNIPSVLRPWILKKAETYAKIAADQKAAFLDRLLDTLDVWKGVEKLLPRAVPPGGESAEPSKLATILSSEMDALQRDAPATQQEQVGKFWTDVRLHWFLRGLTSKKQS